MKNPIRISRLAGILIAALALAPAPLADEGAVVAPSESAPMVAAADAKSEQVTKPAPPAQLPRLAQSGSRVTLDDIYRLLNRQNERLARMEEKINSIETRMDGIEKRMDGIEKRMDRIENRMDRIEGRIEILGGRLDLALTVMLGGLLGIVAILLARREKPRASARPSPAADKTPPAPAH